VERRKVPYVRPAGRQANATQEAFARARSVWPRCDSTTGPNRGRTSPTEVTRGYPKLTCASPPGRARACRVLCGPLGFTVPALFVGPFSSHRLSLLFTTLLDTRPLRRLRARHSLSRFFFNFSLFHLLPSPSTPSLTFAWAAKMRWFRGREAGDDSGASTKGHEKLCDNYTFIGNYTCTHMYTQA